MVFITNYIVTAAPPTRGVWGEVGVTMARASRVTARREQPRRPISPLEPNYAPEDLALLHRRTKPVPAPTQTLLALESEV